MVLSILSAEKSANINSVEFFWYFKHSFSLCFRDHEKNKQCSTQAESTKYQKTEVFKFSLKKNQKYCYCRLQQDKKHILGLYNIYRAIKLTYCSRTSNSFSLTKEFGSQTASLPISQRCLRAVNHNFEGQGTAPIQTYVKLYSLIKCVFLTKSSVKKR